MNQPLAKIQLPDPPKAGSLAKFADLKDAIQVCLNWATTLTSRLQDVLEAIRIQINTQVQGVGDAVASAASIAVANPIFHVTGVATITTITAPQRFSGPIWMIADAAFSLATGGNISRAAGPFSVGETVMLVYDPATDRWYV